MRRSPIARFALLPSLVLVAACSGTLKYTPAPTAKAPEADVKITADVQKDQGNTKLTLAIEHLATPDRLSEGGAHYVVWYRKNSDTTWQRIGALKYDGGSRNGKLDEATVPEIAFELEVTDEKDVSPGSPSPDVIVSQKVSK